MHQESLQIKQTWLRKLNWLLNDAMDEQIKDSDENIAIQDKREKKHLEAIKEVQKIVEELTTPYHRKSLNLPDPHQSSECQTYT